MVSPVESICAPAAVPPGRVQRVLKPVATFVKNALCFVVWWWGLCGIVRQPFPLHVADVAAASGWRVVVLALLGSALLVLVIVDRPWRLGFYWGLLARLVFFPFVGAYHAFVVPYRTFTMSRRVGRRLVMVLCGARPLWGATALAAYVLAGLFLAARAHSVAWLWVTVVIDVLALITLVRFAFQWASEPLVFFEHGIKWLIQVARVTVASQRAQDQGVADAVKPVAEGNRVEHTVEQWTAMLRWARTFTERSTERRIAAKHFMLFFTMGFGLTVVIFGLIYHALTQLGYGIEGAGAVGSHLWQAFYFSLLVITTSADLQATSPVVQTVLASEILYGIGLLSLLILQFSTVSLEVIATRRLHLLCDLEQAVDVVGTVETT